MAIRAAFATTLVAAALGWGATPALAQHVVTDYEAGKLTLDALTATPVVHHILYRMPRYGTVRAVHAASYRHAVRAAAMSHPGTTHRRRRG